jgi:acyl-CoA reductase-like NAD-dependent aldehyde dehydrogenase
MKSCILNAYGKEPVKSKDIGRIINDTHFNRIRKLIDTDKVVVGGQTQVEDKFIAPTLLQNVTMEDAVMQ